MDNQFKLKITVENLAPRNGTLFSPLWFGIHDGRFDTFDLNSPASIAIERLAEDGNAEDLMEDFNDTEGGFAQGLIGTTPDPFLDLFPGDIVSTIVSIDNSIPGSKYFSYASMILPSNDAFFGNENAIEHQIFDDAGNFVPTSFIISGTEILDAGTEVNDEDRFNAVGVGPVPLIDFQPNTGIDEKGVIIQHPGFIPDGNILSPKDVENAVPTSSADFTVPNYPIALISISEVDDTTSEDDDILGQVFGSEDDDLFKVGITPGFDGDGDFVFGSSGDDIFDVTNASGNNLLEGGKDNDLFFLGRNNRIIAGDGDDTIFVSTGSGNVITGGPGTDSFWIAISSLPEGVNTITDFELEVDVLGIGDLDLEFSDLSLTQDGTNTVISTETQDLAILLGVQSNSLSEANFVFV
ncbi:spondin domain-containing protein [Moorena sp. SIO3B2]|uniref:spondin domain-containing protein n=2 Tax=unclassified Moorena TaxID=2683338 RepID=UPI0013C79087|nr:spondin domain-containing protein [Moorena sp. SIO3B2]NEP36456.1 hypothetical protein [Moorena sp. SIO3B2]